MLKDTRICWSSISSSNCSTWNNFIYGHLYLQVIFTCGINENIEVNRIIEALITEAKEIYYGITFKKVSDNTGH